MKSFSKETIVQAAEIILNEKLKKGIIDENLFSKAKTQLEDLRKGGKGEGSKGGKVIGHTKSGKPIYDTHSHKSHSNFDADDHADAEQAHANLYHKHRDKAYTATNQHATAAAKTHENIAENHKQHSLDHQKSRFSSSVSTKDHEDHGHGYTSHREHSSSEGSTGKVYKEGKHVGDYEFDRSSDAFWTKHGSHDTKKEMIDAFKKEHGK